MLHPGGDDEVFRYLLLKHEPHTLHIVLGIAPVSKRVQIAQLQMILKALRDPSRGQGDLSGDKIFSPSLGLMVEEDAVDGEHAVGFPVFLGDPETVLLGHCMGTVGVKMGVLVLRHLLHLAVQLGCGGLIEPGLLLQPQDADGL